MSEESALPADSRTAPEIAAPMTPRFGSLALVLLVTLPVLALDQWSKSFVQSHMQLYQNIPIIPNYFDITYTQNPGAAFSLFTGLPDWFRLAFLATFATAAVIVLVVLMARTPIGLTSLGYALIL
ncbi:MAG TPA: signal peptidase II, partial [Candidatus Binataceae bacterium]|nr:signal peptidase II [Candidatus Binataceae bacterium]